MLILASASPRRKELLEQLGVDFKIEVADCDEIMDDEIAPDVLVQRNASEKAKAVAKLNPQNTVLGADTVVTIDGKILGKPKDREDAFNMLKKLQGRSHYVYTGIALVYHNEEKCIVKTEAVGTEVFFGPMTDKEIENYVATGEPMDKAGAYGIQGKAGAFIEGIRGSYSNVVGLPIYNVKKMLDSINKE